MFLLEQLTRQEIDRSLLFEDAVLFRKKNILKEFYSPDDFPLEKPGEVVRAHYTFLQERVPSGGNDSFIIVSYETIYFSSLLKIQEGDILVFRDNVRVLTHIENDGIWTKAVPKILKDPEISMEIIDQKMPRGDNLSLDTDRSSRLHEVKFKDEKSFQEKEDQSDKEDDYGIAVEFKKK